MLLGSIGCTATIIIFITVNDYHNQQGKRSYFFRSIPAKESLILMSRLAYHATYYLGTIFLFIVGLALFAVTNTASGLRVPLHIAFSVTFDLLVQTKLLPIIIFLIIFSSIEYIISIMFSITIGSQASFKKLGIGGPFVVYFLHYIVMQILTLISMLVIPISAKIPATPDSGEQIQIVFKSMLSEISKFASGQIDSVRTFGIGFIFTTIISWIILYIWTYKSSKNKISLN